MRYSLLAIALLTLAVNASELTYKPVNPNFGGSTLNGGMLLNNAQAQDTFKDPNARASSYTQRSALDRFTDALESRLLNQLLTDVGAGNTGSLVTEDYIVDIIDNGDGGLSISITDQATGDTSVIEVNGLDPEN